MPNFNGFSPSQLRALYQAHHNSGTALRGAAEALQVFKDQGGKVVRERLRLWFGDDSTETLDHVESVVENMIYQYERDNWVGVYTKELENKAYAIADAIRDKGTSHAKLLGQAKTMVDTMVAKEGGPLIIDFSDRFFTLRAAGQGIDSQMQTFLHEFSHLAAGTKDYHWAKSDPRFCYGSQGCMAAKERGVEKARNNAENISFFLTEFWRPG